MKKLFAFAHHCIAHPLLFWTAASTWSARLHDWTARLAWPPEANR